MKISELHLHAVRGLPPIDLSFVDAATQRVRRRTVIAGSNGTGKTTLLDVIHALAGLVYGDEAHAPPMWLKASDNGLAWMRIADLPGLDHDSRDLLLYFCSEDNLPPQFHHFRAVTDAVVYGWTGWPHAGSGFPREAPGGVTQLRRRIERAEQGAGGNGDLPNLLYFPSEQRELWPKHQGQITGREEAYHWVYRFADSDKWAGSLESFLVALDYQDLMAQRSGETETDRFRRLVRVVNGFLHGKQIVGVEKSTFRVLIRADGGQEFAIDALSSGEKQILLLLGEIQRRLARGGVVLIDEPEIHLHPRWQRLLVRALTDMCDEYDAQLIVTTHSEEIAGAVYEHELILLDAVFAGEQSE